MERFKGPITGHEYPLVNAFLERLRKWRERWRQRFSSGKSAKSSLSPTMANTETWEWEDHKGRKRQLVIHREVKE